jgi:2',3'-cyclic-nucleotide 2'-phosphodiesterase (5'-nucleotidase family)
MVVMMMFRNIGFAIVLILAALTVGCLPASAASVISQSSLSTVGVGKSEVSMGDLVADAMRFAVNTDIAFLAASELKESDKQIEKGRVDTQDIVRYVAYTDDPLVVMRLSGRQIKQALERSVLIYPQKNLGFLQVSGMKFTFDPGKQQENRVVSVKIGDKPLSDSQFYSVAMTSSLANGALGYWKIWSKNDIKQVTQKTIPRAVDDFFASRSTVDYSVLNRISIGS